MAVFIDELEALERDKNRHDKEMGLIIPDDADVGEVSEEDGQ